MRKKYSFIEVLLCLREEYLKNELELEKLKELTELHDEKIADYHFKCINSYSNKLLLDREIIKSKFEKLIERINGRIDLSTISECTKDKAGNYVIEEWSYKVPTILDQGAFNEQADRILESDFVKNISNGSVPVYKGDVFFAASVISLERDDYKRLCNYWSYGDILKVKGKTKLDDADFSYLLNTTVHISTLNDWQREAIEKNYDQIGDISFPEIDKPCRNMKLAIEKEGKKVYLKRI